MFDGSEVFPSWLRGHQFRTGDSDVRSEKVRDFGPFQFRHRAGLRAVAESNWSIRAIRSGASARLFGHRPARNQLATDALAQGFEELFWLDADTEFEVEAVERLRSHNLPIISGIYAKKGQRDFASRLLPGTTKITFGQAGGVMEIMYAATGFLLTQRKVYDDIRQQLGTAHLQRAVRPPDGPLFHAAGDADREGTVVSRR